MAKIPIRLHYIHVVSHNDRWVVRDDSLEKIRSVHDTQGDAIEAAKTIAQSMKGELVIHARNGRIRERDSYGSDPLPPKLPRKVLFPTVKSKTRTHEIKKAVSEIMQETQDKTS